MLVHRSIVCASIYMCGAKVAQGVGTLCQCVWLLKVRVPFPGLGRFIVWAGPCCVGKDRVLSRAEKGHCVDGGTGWSVCLSVCLSHFVGACGGRSVRGLQCVDLPVHPLADFRVREDQLLVFGGADPVRVVGGPPVLQEVVLGHDGSHF